MSGPAALGFRAHSGWAALVAVSGDPRAPVILLRRRVELADPEIEGSVQPYHAAEELDLPRAEKLIRRLRESSRLLALQAVRAAISEVRRIGHEVTACGLLLSSGRPLGDLADTLASHAKIHTADGEHFRDAIVHAAERCGLTITKIREKGAWAAAAEKLGASAADLQRRVGGIGKTVGPPWRMDEKLATVAGSVALAAARGQRR